MENLKIQIPQGYEVESFDKNSGEIKFKEKPKNVLERILTDADVFAYNDTSEEQFFKSCNGLDEDETALRFIKLLRKSLHEGIEWIPQDGEWRYEPRFVGGSSGFRFNDCGGWFSLSYVGSRLAFKKDVLAIHAGQHFTKWYKQAIYPQLKTV